MAHGVRQEWAPSPNRPSKEGKGGSRRIFSPQFKLQVLDSYRRDSDCRGNQRATARKYGIHRRQIQKWLQMESTLRCTALEQGEAVALNLAATRQLDVSSPCSAGSIPPPEPSSPEQKTSDSEDDLSSSGSLYYQDQALDFTCAALSRKNFYSLSFKLQVIDAYHQESDQRAVVKKFNIHRRQLQQWLDEEESLRNEAKAECLDLSKKRRLDTFDYEDSPSPKRTFIDLDVPEQPSSVQETALCLIKHPTPPPEVTSSVDLLYRPYTMCCPIPEPSPYDYPQWSRPYYPYYGGIHTSYVTKWLHDDVHYYKQAVKDINLYTPLHS